MSRSFIGSFVLSVLLASIVCAADSKDEAIRKEQKKFEGTWRVVALEIDGNKAMPEDLKMLTVVNGADGTWSVHGSGIELSKGTSTVDPAKSPKTINFTPREGQGKDDQHLGIYEITETTRKVCFAQFGKERPTEFSSPSGSQHILVMFEREKDK